MSDFIAACDWGRAWSSSSRTQGAAFCGAKGKPEELALRARIANDNALDVELYEFARQLTASRQRSHA